MKKEDPEMSDLLEKWYEDLSYDELKGFIRDNLQSMTREFVAVGYYPIHNEYFSHAAISFCCRQKQPSGP